MWGAYVVTSFFTDDDRTAHMSWGKGASTSARTGSAEHPTPGPLPTGLPRSVSCCKGPPERSQPLSDQNPTPVLY